MHLSNTENKKEYKRMLGRTGKIRCSYCPFHKGENNKNWRKRPCWKDKRKTQWK